MNNSTQIETVFSSLPANEREVVISYGAAMRVPGLKQRLFLAQSKIRSFEEKHQTTLAELNRTGLPAQADYDMHEDYVQWSHWSEAAEQCQKDLAILEQITGQGLVTGEVGRRRSLYATPFNRPLWGLPSVSSTCSARCPQNAR